ncbi:hypothetical protein HanRHA438_Chr05g0232641 [Helianthus annuus]|nr:hypothetical protein HanRHA438_Chr05g0232641 [Helianthus annuus]KAJ0923436.1 hypothetical protein HanPSC8_Chr05g0215861 [Helianthus annuus]
MWLCDVMSRKSYRQRLSDIFRRLDAADGLVQLQTPVTRSMLRKRGPLTRAIAARANRACKSVICEDPQPADPDVTLPSADVLTELIPVDPVRRCRLVYERRRGGCSMKNRVDDPGIIAPFVTGGSTSDLAVDPPVLVSGGAVLHTPAEVMATCSHK